MVVEILSPSTRRHDRLVKLLPHEDYGQDDVAKVNTLDGCFIELGKVFAE